MGKALAQAVNVASTTALHTLGERYVDEATGKEYIYVQAAAAIVAQDVCVYSYAYAAQGATATLAQLTSNPGLGVANCAIALSSYGWLQIYGVTTIHAGLGATYNEEFAVSETAGRLEKTSAAATGGGLGRLAGIFISTTCYTAGSAVAGFVNYPTVMRDTGQV